MDTIVASGRLRVARTVAEGLLHGLADRWAHTTAVAHRAEQLSPAVPAADREALVVAAWLHDIGYSPAVQATGFHPLDGAAYLDRHGWPPRICGLVAHHSGAGYLADALGLRAELDRYRHEQSPVSDALAYADQTVGPHGQPMSVEERIAEALDRHGAGSAQATVHPERAPFLRAAVERVRHRLSQVGC